jgi:hypothetical protein
MVNPLLLVGSVRLVDYIDNIRNVNDRINSVEKAIENDIFPAVYLLNTIDLNNIYELVYKRINTAAMNQWT